MSYKFRFENGQYTSIPVEPRTEEQAHRLYPVGTKIFFERGRIAKMILPDNRTFKTIAVALA